MNDITILNGQSLFDIALENSGSTLSAFEYALKNGISVTEVLTTGNSLLRPISNFENKSVMNFFLERNIATEMDAKEDEVIPLGGIGVMIIETNFIVS